MATVASSCILIALANNIYKVIPTETKNKDSKAMIVEMDNLSKAKLFAVVHRYGGRDLRNQYGAGSGQIWLDNVQCTGTETSIAHCRHSSWGSHNCRHSDDVSVSCIARTFVISALNDYL